jgi:hypothetical protein
MWWLGLKGQACAQCGFYEASHYKHDLEFDMEAYPCERFKFPRNDSTVQESDDGK